jgi:hypothetical protein
MAKIDPTAARSAFLDALTPEEQNGILRRAERTGPAKDDADWLIAYAMLRAVDQIKTAVSEFEDKSGAGAPHSCRSKTSSHSVSLVLWSVAVSLGIFFAITEFVVRFSSAHLQEVAVYCLALVIGISGSALYASLAPYFIRQSKKKH